MPSFNTYKYCNADKFPIKVGKGCSSHSGQFRKISAGTRFWLYKKKKKKSIHSASMHFELFFSKFFHLISNINLTLPNDMLGRKNKIKLKKPREVDSRISDQYQIIC